MAKNKGCRFFHGFVKDDGILRTDSPPSDRVFKYAGVGNDDPESPVVVTLAYSDGPGLDLKAVESVEVEPEGAYHFNPEDYEFDISPNGFVELQVSAPGGGKVLLSMMTCDP